MQKFRERPRAASVDREGLETDLSHKLGLAHPAVAMDMRAQPATCRTGSILYQHICLKQMTCFSQSHGMWGARTCCVRREGCRELLYSLCTAHQAI